MEIRSLRVAIAGRLTTFVADLINSRRSASVQPSPMDGLQLEISRVEQMFNEVKSRPKTVIHTSKPLTEQQKIIDLAG